MKFAIAFTLAAFSAAAELRAETGGIPRNNDEISEFLDKYSRWGAPKGIRYVGRQVWMSENCLDLDS